MKSIPKTIRVDAYRSAPGLLRALRTRGPRSGAGGRARSAVVAVSIAVAFFVGSVATAQQVTISQVDPSRILANQHVRLYVSVTDEAGEPIEELPLSGFSVAEAPGPDAPFAPIESVLVLEKANVSAGIHFFLLVDNSGSMYDTLDGEPTENADEMRMTHAREAIREFLNDMTNSADTVGLASFNTYFTEHSQPTKKKLEVYRALEEIERPERAAGYTELYAAIDRAARIIGEFRGRKVIIVLSDGENYPYARFEPDGHPEFGDRIWRYDEPIETLGSEAVTAFAVNFGPNRDPNLDEIAVASGGVVFDASNRRELTNVYNEIRNRVLKEYLVSYPATMAPALEKRVRVTVDIDGAKRTDTRSYFSSTVFGMHVEEFAWWLVLPLLIALAAWFGLTQLRFANRAATANLEVLDAAGGKAATRVMSIEANETVIGGNDEADLTIVGARELKQNHATIVRDEKTGSYTVVSEQAIRVNNQPVKKRTLEAGDVLNVGGTIIVFDEAQEERRRRGKNEAEDTETEKGS